MNFFFFITVSLSFQNDYQMHESCSMINHREYLIILKTIRTKLLRTNVHLRPRFISRPWIGLAKLDLRTGSLRSDAYDRPGHSVNFEFIHNFSVCLASCHPDCNLKYVQSRFLAKWKLHLRFNFRKSCNFYCYPVDFYF